ncbi:hypothetical protein EDD15DRAFT_2379841 [Pisolithus albus]|nr:hypothetical protein EDD15DRAFT_2379841 [Pisolithus albus]
MKLHMRIVDGQHSHIRKVSGGPLPTLSTDGQNVDIDFVQSMGLDSLMINDSADLVDSMMNRMIDEVPVLEVDGLFYDPSAGKHVLRLAHPVLLTIALLPSNFSNSSKQPKVSGPVVVHRWMELLA